MKKISFILLLAVMGCKKESQQHLSELNQKEFTGVDVQLKGPSSCLKRLGNATIIIEVLNDEEIRLKHLSFGPLIYIPPMQFIYTGEWFDIYKQKHYCFTLVEGEDSLCRYWIVPFKSLGDKNYSLDLVPANNKIYLKTGYLDIPRPQGETHLEFSY